MLNQHALVGNKIKNNLKKPKGLQLFIFNKIYVTKTLLDIVDFLR